MALVFVPGGPLNGITGKAGSLPRLHATGANDWDKAPAWCTDFWFTPAIDLNTASSPGLLSAQGWLAAGTISFVAGTGADFLSSADPGVIAHMLLDATGERLTSPFIFGQDWKTRYIRDQLGWQPKKLIADFTAIWTTASNADTTGGIGFVEAGGAIQTAADHLAMLTSDGTNFILRSGAATSDFAGAVTLTSARWRIELNLTSQLAILYKNGSLFDSIALEADLFPCAFGAACTSSNDLGLGDAHVYYSD